ncbi:MAG TPA: hypothetical protein VJC37_02985 [Planctomycetota bacterium]|nr:hypothetical protein [Planctomycetota bacterium]
MPESRFQLSDDTWAYVDYARSKLVVEIDLPQEGNNNNQTSKDDAHSETHRMN